MRLWASISALFRRPARQPLAARRPARDDTGPVPLGMEATDLALIARVTRRNDTLERATGARASTGALRRASTDVTPMPEDETYAARYHRAFQQKGK